MKAFDFAILALVMIANIAFAAVALPAMPAYAARFAAKIYSVPANAEPYVGL